ETSVDRVHGVAGQKKTGRLSPPGSDERGSGAQGTYRALEKALLAPWVTPLSRICALICCPAVMTPAPNAALALVASAHLPSTTVQQRFAAERIASKDVGPAVHPIGSALVQPCVVSLMVAARHRFAPSHVTPAILIANLMSGVPVTPAESLPPPVAGSNAHASVVAAGWCAGNVRDPVVVSLVAPASAQFRARVSWTLLAFFGSPGRTANAVLPRSRLPTIEQRIAPTILRID